MTQQTTVPPLTVAEIQRFRKSLRLLERLVSGQLKDETSCCGVTAAQCHVMLELSDKGNAHISELAEEFGLDRSTLSRTIDGLVSAGMAKRSEDPDDRRYSRVTLTGKGKEKVSHIDKLCNEDYTKLFSFIKETKRSAVIESIELLTAAMDRFRKTVSCCINGDIS